MSSLIFDPFAGASGDMILGALVDLGVEPDWLRSFVDGLGVGSVGVEIGRTVRCGIACTRVRFDLPQEQTHRHLKDIISIVRGSGASERVQGRAIEVFQAIAAAEATIHGVPVERVHFHEVGALDSILDVLCVCASVDRLGAPSCYTRPVAIGRGSVRIEHGDFPLPAPATLSLLRGITVRETGYAEECTTPTGAALLSVLSGGKAPPAEWSQVAVGYGAGMRDTADRPNCLRAVLATVPEGSGDSLYLLQADLDDMPSEYLPPAVDGLLRAGAADAMLVPTVMKKGRPGARVEALVPAAALDRCMQALFRSTSTLGVRFWPVERRVLARSTEVIEWEGQRIRVKRATLPGGGERAKPEFEDLVQAAEATGRTVLEVRRALERNEIGRFEVKE